MIHRRTFLGCAAATLAAAALPALAEQSAGAFVLEQTNAVLDIIRKDPKLQKADPERVRKLIDERIQPYADLRKMTRMSVGPAWRQASEEQRAALTTEYREMLTRVYSGAFASVKDHKVELRPGKEAAGNDVIVRTLVKSAGTDPIAIDYRVYKDKKGAWLIYDVNVEGIWLVANYRSQFSQVVNTSGVDGLLRQLREKNRAAAAAK